MKAILQLSTGVYASCTELNTEEIRNRMEKLMERIPVSGVIYGWGRRPGLFETIVKTAHAHGAEAFLWMPVFADVRNPEDMDPMVFWGEDGENSVNTCPGEEFRFVCPGSSQNRDAVTEDYALLSKEITPDGVFLDRIRYPSAVFSRNHILGCRCEKCLEALREAGVDPGRIHQLTEPEGGFGGLRPERMENNRYHYRDPDLEGLSERKRRTIADAVKRYTEFFRAKSLKIGIDAFAPALADLVGQDLFRLLPEVDFVKPMMYYRTMAPAGIPYELNAFGKETADRLSDLWGTDIRRIGSMERQLHSLGMEEKLYPGIEINRIPGICEPGENDFRQAIRAARNAGCNRIVLSWNVMQARDEELNHAAKYLNET